MKAAWHGLILRRRHRGKVIKKFVVTPFGLAELEIIDEVLSSWLAENGLLRNSVEGELAAAVLINLFREGDTTVSLLSDAARHHLALIDLGSVAAQATIPNEIGRGTSCL